MGGNSKALPSCFHSCVPPYSWTRRPRTRAPSLSYSEALQFSQVFLHLIWRRHAFINIHVVDIHRHCRLNYQILGQCSNHNRSYDHGCCVRLESQTSLPDYGLKRPQGFMNSNLQIGLSQIQDRNRCSLLPPLSQLLGAYVGIGSESVHVFI